MLTLDAKMKAKPQIMILLWGEWQQKGIYCETKSSIISDICGDSLYRYLNKAIIG